MGFWGLPRGTQNASKMLLERPWGTLLRPLGAQGSPRRAPNLNLTKSWVPFGLLWVPAGLRFDPCWLLFVYISSSLVSAPFCKLHSPRLKPPAFKCHSQMKKSNTTCGATLFFRFIFHLESQTSCTQSLNNSKHQSFKASWCLGGCREAQTIRPPPCGAKACWTTAYRPP